METDTSPYTQLTNATTFWHFVNTNRGWFWLSGDESALFAKLQVTALGIIQREKEPAHPTLYGILRKRMEALQSGLAIDDAIMERAHAEVREQPQLIEHAKALLDKLGVNPSS